MTTTITGWLLDVYPNETNLTVWLIGEDGQRQRFVQDFSACLYVASPAAPLRQLWKWLKQQAIPVRLSRAERRDVFQGLIPVLAVEILQPAKVDELFRSMAAAFPELTWYDADISIPLRYMAAFDVFPLAQVRLEVKDEKIVRITPLDTPWELPGTSPACASAAPSWPACACATGAGGRDRAGTGAPGAGRCVDPSLARDGTGTGEPASAPLRILSLEPDCDPAHAQPRKIIISYERIRYSLPLDKATPLLVSLRADLRRYDPDVLLTSWGDTWLLPLLMKLAQESGLSLPLNRDESQGVVRRKETTYFSYGQIVYRGAQVLLRGRWHLDRHNAMLWHDYGLTGVLEMARVTRQPVQEAARLSPGTGISSMQFVTALQNGILIPWHKQQVETPKTAMELVRADMGGMVYQPTIGLHRDVGGIDFVSMYPGIMVRFNISPEVPRAGNDLEPGRGEPGIIPRTLAPLLNKRLALKSALLTLNKYDCRRPVYQALASAHKWLLVTCFGYLGYKNARFGRIEAHEAVTAYGREALLRAKEAAEDLDFEILHMYVDGLWVHKQGCKTPADFQALLADITERTGLPISMDGVYRWVVFLSSRLNARVPVANRYFGVFQDGSIKVRGIEARRRDTAPFLTETQMRLLEILACAPDVDHLKDVLPQAHAFVRAQDMALRLGRVPLEQLLVSQKLSRELGEYSSPSPAARAVWQMQAAGKVVRPGQRVRFLFTLGKPGVCAWDAPERPDPRSVDVPRYRTLLERAVWTVLDPVEQAVGGGADRECLDLFAPLNPGSGNRYSEIVTRDS